jgi:hypothetical protein
MFLNDPWFKKYINIKIFSTLKSPQHFLCIFQCPSTLYPMPLIFKVLILSIVWKKENFHVQLNTLGISNVLF